ncbi:receptor-interacting serine/threonine-protein kinase 4-like isoform X2 [Salvia splendens]|uniref:receptor-interacting serine/threonine-protein kinase 4-like isoform X2 n=1 Tax=Salvia splendens TaxID=180675 RepID=UPI001C26B81E|nr:receptor-interacting serine/threonine-protein kinase 4-like isoform X2 [Salvia splendens]
MGSISEIGAAIIEAAASGDLNQLRVIRNKVDDISEYRKICDEYSDFTTGRNVLHHVVEMGNFEICKFLIKTVKVYIDALTYKGDTPLAQAVKGEHVKIVKFLINQRAEINLSDVEGFTPLHYAVLKDNMEVMELLKGALVEEASTGGTPLQVAVSRGNVQAVKYLLSRGAHPSRYCAAVDTPLTCAVKSRSFECLKLLLAANADPNSYFSSSPLASAAKEGDTKFLECLLKAKADPNTIERDFYIKPIEDAAMVHNRAAVKILFPVTKRLEIYPNWTVDGIIESFHSEEFKTLREQKRTMHLAGLEAQGMHEASNKQYRTATLVYRMASLLDPSNPTWLSKRMLLQAHADETIFALLDAQECIRLKPDFPVPHPHHTGDIAAAANQIFKKFLMAGLAFSLDPYNEATLCAFRVTMFDYFASFSQMSSPDMILSFS